MRVRVALYAFTSLFSSIVTTSSSLIFEARHFPVIVKTLAFDSLTESLFESAQWRISFAEIFRESLSSGKLLKWADAASSAQRSTCELTCSGRSLMNSMKNSGPKIYIYIYIYIFFFFFLRIELFYTAHRNSMVFVLKAKKWVSAEKTHITFP